MPAILLVALAGCGGGNPPVDGGGDSGSLDTGNGDGGQGAARTLPTQGSAVALSADDRVAVVANRTAGTIGVFNVTLSGTPPTASRIAELSVGAHAEPWAVVVGNDGNTAFAILRHDRRVVKITGLTSTPALASQSANTGSEPTGLAISPSGAKLYVANWAEGTVSVFNTADLSDAGTIDLNGALAGSGLLGPSVTAGRVGLAHPRAIVITNNGDGSDADETAYVTEFFSQARTNGLPTGDARFDVGRQGVVYRFNVGTGAVAAPITIAPVDDTGFVDSDGNHTGCFPNQLYAAAVNSGRLYVTSVCESPRGPTGPVVTGGMTNIANFKTEVHAAVFVVDTASNAELPAQRVVLTRAFQDLYDGPNPAMPTTPDDGANRRMPLVPNDIAFVPTSSIAYLTSYGSDAVFRVHFNADGTLAEVGGNNKFINLNPGGSTLAGRLPVGIAIANNPGAANGALVINENSRALSVLSFATQSVVAAVQATDPPAAGSADEQVNDGRRFFVTGLGRWSLKGQGWNSCEGCHPDGLTDNATWFFARGPRQTISLDGTFSPDGTQQRILNWTAIFDEVQDFELNTRGNSGGVGAIVHASSMPPVAGDRIIFDGTTVTAPQVATETPQAGLNGAASSISSPTASGMVKSVIDDFDRITRYVATIRAPRAPVHLDAAHVSSGRTIFANNNCGGCHGGADWTISRRFYTPNETNNNPMTGLLRSRTYTLPAMFPAALNPPAMAGAAPLRFTNSDAMVVGANDQINCVLRAVGTVPAGLGTMGGPLDGIAPAGVIVREVRTNMTSPAQGATGFNPPSLFGMVSGAPYFHAGNARTLEEVFDTTFHAHYQALSSNFLDVGDRAQQVRDLVEFLLSIDEDTMTVSPMGGAPPLGYNPDLCPVTL